MYSTFFRKKKNLPFRLKINLSKKLFFYNLIKEKKKYNLSYTLYFLILTFLFFIIKLFQIFSRISFLFDKYFKKIIKHKTLIIVSNDRYKYPSFTILNDFLKKKRDF